MMSVTNRVCSVRRHYDVTGCLYYNYIVIDKAVMLWRTRL